MRMNQTRGLYCLFTAVFVVFFLAATRQWAYMSGQQKLRTHKNGGERGRPSFEEVALKHGTDKVTTHKYQFMYDKYLEPYRGKSIKLLEIGLGCNMNYGPGASYYTWLEYLPGVELYFIEYDAACADKYKHRTTSAHVYTGNQEDAEFLTNFTVEATEDGTNLFDVIIDDGGHTMNQQITSLQYLWRIVKPGGLYIIEDLQTSYWENYGGDPSAKDATRLTTMKYLYGLLDDMMAGREVKTNSHELESIDCMAEICALRKKQRQRTLP